MEREIVNIWTGLNSHLHSFVLKKVQDREVAKDIIQDVFLKVQAKIGTLKENGKVTSWIFQITRNAISDHYRTGQKAAHSGLSLVDIGEVLPDQSVPDGLTHEFAQCMRPLIATLPEKYREALVLSELEGMSQKALAEKLGISYSAAKSRVQRGREMLKEVLLQCCEIETDPYGNIVDYHRKGFPKNCL